VKHHARGLLPGIGWGAKIKVYRGGKAILG